MSILSNILKGLPGDIKRPFKKGRTSTTIIKTLAPLALANLPGAAGKFFGSGAGQAILSVFNSSGGNTAAVSGILEALGIKGRTKDMVEQFLALAALSKLGDVFAKDALNRAKALEEKEEKTITAMLERSEELFPTPEREEKELAKGVEDIRRETEREGKELLRTLSQRGALTTGAGAGQIRRLLQDEGERRLMLQRNIELARTPRTAEALRAQAAILSPLSDAAARARLLGEQQRLVPIQAGLALYEANRRSPLDEFLAAEIARRGGGGGVPATGGGLFPAGATLGSLANFNTTPSLGGLGAFTSPGINPTPTPAPGLLSPSSIALGTIRGFGAATGQTSPFSLGQTTLTSPFRLGGVGIRG